MSNRSIIVRFSFDDSYENINDLRTKVVRLVVRKSLFVQKFNDSRTSFNRTIFVRKSYDQSYENRTINRTKIVRFSWDDSYENIARFEDENRAISRTKIIRLSVRKLYDLDDEAYENHISCMRKAFRAKHGMELHHDRFVRKPSYENINGLRTKFVRLVVRKS